MTFNSLKTELAALGFENSIEMDNNLICAVKQALSTVYTERGKLSQITLNHFPHLPTLLFSKHTHEGGECTFDLRGRAFSFTACGKGEYVIESRLGSEHHSFNTPHYVGRGFIPESATVTFLGDYPFTVLDLSVFEYPPSEDLDDVFIYGEPFVYKVGEIVGDFHSFASPPLDENGRVIEGSSISADSFTVPWGYSGRILIKYRVCPPTVSADSPDADLGVPRECEHLIPLLAAAYYWLDDDSEKAAVYLSLYREALRGIKLNGRAGQGNGYDNVTGWA